jgi:hypothetical protein
MSNGWRHHGQYLVEAFETVFGFGIGLGGPVLHEGLEHLPQQSRRRVDGMIAVQ